MIIFFTIFHYLAAAVVDVMDKVLISKDRIRPFNYTFFTVVTGAAALLAWPWVFESLPQKYILLDLLSGAFFSLTLYIFFKALSEGEVSRVVPFIFSFIAVFDILISLAVGKSNLRISQVAAMFLLIPGALLLSYSQSGFPRKHVFLKLFSALLFSAYNWLWQYGAQIGSVLNNYMWGRLGAAGVIILLLVIPSIRGQITGVKRMKEKSFTSLLFIIKQLLGGINFIFYSFLTALGNIVVVDSMQGLRYVFLLVLGLAISHKRGHIFKEEAGKAAAFLKLGAIFLIVLGTAMLFV